jgi:alcohol dehydrogenase (cytochrome c)
MRDLAASIVAGLMLVAAAQPAGTSEVTHRRLVNADAEPHNWLTNHRTFDAHRYSPLSLINRDNVGQLKLAYAVALGGTSPNENLEATPLAEDGFLYVVDQWGVVTKIDARSGHLGRTVWRMDPGQKALPLANRGAALWGDLVISAANYPPRIVASNKDTGRPVWTADLSDGQPDLQLTAAPLAVKDKIIVGAAGGDLGVRDFVAALDAATGRLLWRKYVIPAPGEPGSETWKAGDAWRTGGGAMWVTGSYDVDSNQVIWGTGNPVPAFDPTYRPGDNLFTNSAISWDPDTGRMNWHFQYTPGDRWDYDEAGTHIVIDGAGSGASRPLITHAARNGFLYTIERGSGRVVFARPYMDNVNWTKGIDQTTGKPLDYDASKDIQVYAGLAEPPVGDRTRTRRLCPSPSGGANFWPATYSRRTRLLYIPVLTGCVELTTFPFEPARQNWRGGNDRPLERMESSLTVADPFTGEIKKVIRLAYPNYAGALSTGGGLVFVGLLDGTVMAFDDTTFEPLWKINLGVGFNAPPMTFAVDGRQYVAILSGLSGIARAKLALTPELQHLRNQTMLFVFGL